MLRPALLALATMIVGAAPVAAQTGANAAGASGLAPRPVAPNSTTAAPVKPTVSGHLTSLTRGFMQVQTQYTGNVVSQTL
ncbi:MAG: hypothetical protein ACOYMK_10495, partial [Hyphomonadaceae bacterium]